MLTHVILFLITITLIKSNMRRAYNSFSTVCEGGRDPHITISVGYWGVSDFLCKM